MEVSQKITTAETLSSLIKSTSHYNVLTLDKFISAGIPNRKNEEYKYSLPEKYLSKITAIAKEEKLNALHLKNIESVLSKYFGFCNYLVLNNGFVSKKDISVTGLTLKTTDARTEVVSDDAFVHLNNAAQNVGYQIEISADYKNESPLVIINYTNQSNIISNGYVNIHTSKNVNANIFEINIVEDGAKDFFVNNLVNISVGANAHLTYYKLQDAGYNDTQLSTVIVSQENDSTFDTNTVSLSGLWIRNNLSILLNGKNCTTHLNGLYFGKNTFHIDNHTLVDHRQPHCNSNQLYKGVLFDKSEAVFNGKIYVQLDAQKTNAYQSSKNILMSDDASVNAKPQLEILADDVKCSHGSSTGKIDKQALFYLQARGIGVESAKNLLLKAFVSDALHTIQVETYREALEERIASELGI